MLLEDLQVGCLISKMDLEALIFFFSRLLLWRGDLAGWFDDARALF